MGILDWFGGGGGDSTDSDTDTDTDSDTDTETDPTDPGTVDPPDPGDDTEPITWNSLAPDWMTKNDGFLKTFVKNPRKTILGAILGAIVAGIQDIWLIVLDALTMLWWGSDPASTAGQLGLADLPVWTAEILIGAGSPLASSIITLIGGMYTGLEDMFTGLGPLAFPVAVGSIMVVLILTQRLARRIGPAVLDAVPLVGTPLKTLLFGP